MDAALFGPRLKELRVKASLSQPALAEKAGLSASAVMQWEIGRREPSWSGVLAICRALDVKPNDFTVEASGEARDMPRGRPPKPPPEPPRKKTRTKRSSPQK